MWCHQPGNGREAMGYRAVLLSPRVLGAALTMTVLGGCAVSDYQRPTIDRVSPGDERIIFAADEFRGTAPQRVKFTDIWQREEFALFRGSGAQAEIMYITVTQPVFTIALEYQFMVDDMVETWNLNRKHAKAWGHSKPIEARLATYFYKSYRLTEINRACFGFAAEWDHRNDDSYHRPSQVLFGYFCAKAGASLAAHRMEELIRMIGVRGVTDPLGTADPSRRGSGGGAAVRRPDVHPRADAALIAQGSSPSADSGNPSFPFDLAEFYPESPGV